MVHNVLVCAANEEAHYSNNLCVFSVHGRRQIDGVVAAPPFLSYSTHTVTSAMYVCVGGGISKHSTRSGAQSATVLFRPFSSVYVAVGGAWMVRGVT